MTGYADYAECNSQQEKGSVINMENEEDNQMLRELGKIVTGGFYGYQEIRKANMNRVRSLIARRDRGMSLGEVEEKKEKKEDRAYGKEYNDAKILELVANLKKEGRLSHDEYEYILKTFILFDEAANMEASHKKLMEIYIVTEPIWQEWLKDIRGISIILASNLIKNFGYCERYRYNSSLWKHCGMDVQNGAAPKREKGKKTTYNPALRTLAWKIGDSFVKQRTDPYRGIYDLEKATQLQLLEVKDEFKDTSHTAPNSRGHADLRARRKMVKVFLQHYWIVTRTLKGLEVTKPYSVEKLEHHYIPPQGWEKVLEAAKVINM